MADGDDLHGRQLVLLLVFFGSIGGGLYFIGWLTRPSWFWDNPLACAAIAGAACYPAVFLVERFAWWKRLEPGQDPRGRARRSSIRRSRRRSRPRNPGRERRLSILLAALRIIVGGSIALASLAILPLGLSANRENERLVRTCPVQQAVVVTVEEDKWSKYDDVVVKVARPSDGKVIELDGGNDLRPRPREGDRIDVVVDPQDPIIIIAATVDWSTPWWGYLLGAIITVIIFGIGLAILLP
jgi:hypothetical protein